MVSMFSFFDKGISFFVIRNISISLNVMLRSKTEHTERLLGDDLAGECDPDCDADQP